MDKEMEALVGNKTWVLVPKGVTQKAIGCKLGIEGKTQF